MMRLGLVMAPKCFCFPNKKDDVNTWYCWYLMDQIRSPVSSGTILLMEEVLHQLIGSLSYYLQGFINPRWCRFLPSTAWYTCPICAGFLRQLSPFQRPNLESQGYHFFATSPHGQAGKPVPRPPQQSSTSINSSSSPLQELPSGVWLTMLFALLNIWAGFVAGR